MNTELEVKVINPVNNAPLNLKVRVLLMKCLDVVYKPFFKYIGAEDIYNEMQKAGHKEIVDEYLAIKRR